MLPSRGAFLLAFGGVVLAGILGGIIGYGIADVSSQSDVSHLVGTFIGSFIGAAGVGIVAVLVLRAMAEWRRQNPARRSNRRLAVVSGRAQAPKVSLRKGSAYLMPAAAPASSARSRRKSRNHSPLSTSWLAWQKSAVDLALERVADVDPAVRLERARQVDVADVVHREALGEVLGEVVRVAGGGRDRVERRPAGDAVVAVVVVAVAEEHRGRVGTEHDIGRAARGSPG